MSSQKFLTPDFPNKFSNICFFAEADIHTYTVYKLRQNVESIKQATYSPILTLGAFILFHHNKAQPPRFQCDQKTNGKVDATYPSPQLTVNNYHELWNDYLSNLVLERKVYQVETQLYFVDFVDQNYLDSFVQSQVFYSFTIKKEELKEFTMANDFSSIIQYIYRLEKIKVPKTKKYAAVCFASRPPTKDRYIPRVHVKAMFYGLFYRETDVWTAYKPNQGILPTLNELQQLDGVVLSGSGHSVYEDLPEINHFMSMLLEAYKKSSKLKILGFCFGHQSIAYAFGGKVQAMKQKVVYLQNIYFNPKKIKDLQFEWLNRESPFLSGKQAYFVSEFHGDEVVVVPQGFTVIGSSESCPVEAMVSNDGRCMSFQFHMEYAPEFGGAYELRVKSYDLNINYGIIFHGSSKFKSCERNSRSLFELRELSRNFLHSDNIGQK